MDKPKFYQAVLEEVQGNVFDHVYPDMKKHFIDQFSIEDRLGNPEGKCPDCEGNSWIILPEESSAVQEGGKPYIECMHCGYNTHL